MHQALIVNSNSDNRNHFSVLQSMVSAVCLPHVVQEGAPREGWLKKELRRRDFQALMSGRGVLGKTAYKARVRLVLKRKKTQKVWTAV